MQGISHFGMRVGAALRRVQSLLIDEGPAGVTEKKRFSYGFAFGISGLIIAWLSQPLIRHADASLLLMTGMLIVLIVFAITYFYNFTSRGARTAAILAALALLVPTGILTVAVVRDAVSSDLANEGRCLTLQNDMLSASPRRTDGPALFEALGCQPQGEGKVSLERTPQPPPRLP